MTPDQPHGTCPAKPEGRSGKKLARRGGRSRHAYVTWGVALGVLAAAIAATVLLLRARRDAQSRTCVSTMCSIIAAAHMYADDHDGVMPSSLEELRPSYVDNPKVFICPADRTRQPAADSCTLTPDNCSYEVVTPGLHTNVPSDTIFLRCKMHGHVGYVDMTVFDGEHRRTKYGIAE